MLEKALRPFGLRRLVNPRIDTMYLAARLEEGPFFDVHTAKKGTIPWMLSARAMGCPPRIATRREAMHWRRLDCCSSFCSWLKRREFVP
ncbi:hypothetical protein [Nitritalea halalkaliphila]|nr:hypothetical protein [Nitritalea halalkaliphila]